MSHENLPTALESVKATNSHQDTLIYDGQCSFCIRQVDRIRARDGGRLAYLSLHDPLVTQRWPELSHEELMKQMYLVEPDGRKYAGASAVKALTRKLPRLWWLFPLLHCPGSMPIWRFLYARIAKMRYRLAGRRCDNGSCSLHV